MKRGLYIWKFYSLKLISLEKDIKSHEYETTKVTFDLNQMPPEDKIEWHKQTGNMVSRDLMQATIQFKKDENAK
jgi:hypothetical protein